MFSKPTAGWTRITIGDYEGHGSYLTDIPMDFLKASLNSLHSKCVFAMFIDEEGTESFITSYHFQTIVNRLTDDMKTHYSQTDFHDLIRNGLADIEEHFEDWVRFDGEDDEEELKARRGVYSYFIKEIKSLLDE